MPRSDLSKHVAHFTKTTIDKDAFQRFKEIISSRRINSTTNFIKGLYKCVCFTEAPLCSVENGLANHEAYQRYAPFGIMFDKTYIYAKGGRPVIYQAENEYDSLPESHKWRHVRYEPCEEYPTDWTWEREWRLQCDGIDFNPSDAVLVVPTQDYAHRLKDEYEAEQILQYSQFIDKLLTIQNGGNIKWRIAFLENKA